ncbi:MAG: protein tyrosine phosphatase family protein [Rhodovibrionaceae bacterium]|nr:protein tyrosine phosphatase family protein [Rhodovibrionaceae bacterium]
MLHHAARSLTALPIAAVLTLWLAAFPAAAEPAEAPFGDSVNESIFNYSRMSPRIAGAGELREGAIAHLKALGFVAVLDLRTAQEGTAKERAAVEKAGLVYHNISVATRAPTWAQVAEFARIVNDADNLPILVHCASANRVGAMWALYRSSQGVNPEFAIQEGRTAGLTSRENAVRARLAE